MADEIPRGPHEAGDADLTRALGAIGTTTPPAPPAGQHPRPLDAVKDQAARTLARIAAMRRTGKWAVTMTRLKITVATQGKDRRRWNVVSFTGPGGQESRGIVDLVAIRKNQRLPLDGSKRGDKFEMVLIQVKGGSSPCPSDEDIDRLRLAARQYKAEVVLSEWQRAKTLRFSRLSMSNKRPWEELTDAEVRKLFR